MNASFGVLFHFLKKIKFLINNNMDHQNSSKSGESEAVRLKTLGNECFKDKRYNKAIDYYTKSLDNEINSIVLSNRAQAYLNLKK